MDRLDFEELALKSFDTSLGPKLLPVGGKDQIKPSEIPTVSASDLCIKCLAHRLTQHSP